MKLAEFRKSFDPARTTLAKIDALTAQAGEHFNEAQQEQAKALIADYDEATSDAVEDARKALADDAIEEHEEELEETELDPDHPEFEPKDGDVFLFSDGKLKRFVPASGLSKAEAAAGEKIEIVGQANQLEGPLDPITKAAHDSIEHNLEEHRVKDTGKNPGVTTTQASDPKDKKAAIAAAELELATSEGDTQIHHIEDGSRSINDAADTEALKILAPNVPTQQSSAPSPDPSAAVVALQGANSSNTFTPSIDADKPADEAAVEAGAQEVLIPASTPEGTAGVIVDTVKLDPPDPANLIDHIGIDPNYRPG